MLLNSILSCYEEEVSRDLLAGCSRTDLIWTVQWVQMLFLCGISASLEEAMMLGPLSNLGKFIYWVEEGKDIYNKQLYMHLMTHSLNSFGVYCEHADHNLQTFKWASLK